MGPFGANRLGGIFAQSMGEPAARTRHDRRWRDRERWLRAQYIFGSPTSRHYNAQPFNQLARIYLARGDYDNANGILARKVHFETVLGARTLRRSALIASIGLAMFCPALINVLSKPSGEAGAALGLLLLLLGVFIYVGLIAAWMQFAIYDYQARKLQRAGSVRLKQASLLMAYAMTAFWLVSLFVGPAAPNLIWSIAVLAVWAVAARRHYQARREAEHIALKPNDPPIFAGGEAGAPALAPIMLAVLFSLGSEVLRLQNPAEGFVIGASLGFFLVIAAWASSRLFELVYWIGFRYGLSPTRALVSCVALLVAGAYAVDRALEHDLLIIDVQYAATLVSDADGEFPALIGFQGDGAPEAPPSCNGIIDPLAYAADLFLPLIDLQQEGRCIIRPWIVSTPGPADYERAVTACLENDQDACAEMPPWRYAALASHPADFVDRAAAAIKNDPITLVWAKAAYTLLGWIFVSMTIVTVIGSVRRRLGERSDI